MESSGFKLDYDDVYGLDNGELLYRIIADGHKTKPDGTKGGYASEALIMDSSSWIYDDCVIRGKVSVTNKSELKDCTIMNIFRSNIIIIGSKINTTCITTEYTESILIKDTIMVSSNEPPMRFYFSSDNTIIDNCVLDSLGISDVMFSGQYCILKDIELVDTDFKCTDKCYYNSNEMDRIENLTITNSDTFYGTIAVQGEHSRVNLSDITIEKGGSLDLCRSGGNVIVVCGSQLK